MLLIVQLYTNINYCSYLLYFCDLLPNYFLLTFAIMHHVNVQLIVIHNLMYQFYEIFKKHDKRYVKVLSVFISQPCTNNNNIPMGHNEKCVSCS